VTTPVRDGDGVRGQRVVLVALVVVVVLIAVGLSVEQRLRADFQVLDRTPTTGTDLGDELPEAELMPAPPPVPPAGPDGGPEGRGPDS
jgi:hypothetical protein